MDVNNAPVTPAMRLQVELALAHARGDVDALRPLEAQARRMMLTGAEIDAAKRGGSFDAITCVAVKFALAVNAGDEPAIAATKARLAALGLPSIATALVALLEELHISSSK